MAADCAVLHAPRPISAALSKSPSGTTGALDWAWLRAALVRSGRCGMRERAAGQPYAAPGRFLGIDLDRERVPNATTLLKFCRRLETHKLGEALFAQVGEVLQARGLKVGTGTIVDATIIGAPSSTKNVEKKRDALMHRTRALPGGAVLWRLRLCLTDRADPLQSDEGARPAQSAGTQRQHCRRVEAPDEPGQVPSIRALFSTALTL